VEKKRKMSNHASKRGSRGGGRGAQSKTETRPAEVPIEIRGTEAQGMGGKKARNDTSAHLMWEKIAQPSPRAGDVCVLLARVGGAGDCSTWRQIRGLGAD